MIRTKTCFSSVVFATSAFIPLLVLVSSAAQAAQVYVAPATGSGVSPSDLETTTELIQTAVPDVSSNTITNDQDKADLILQPRVVRLGEAYILSLSKIQNGETVYSSELKAAHIEELDKVSERLTRSVLAGERAKSNPRVGEITDEEAKQGTQRRPVRTENYIGFGGTTLGNLNTNGTGYSIGLAHGWDVNSAVLKIMGEGDFNGSAFFASAGIGADYFLSMSDVAPYLSADFGGGVAKVDAGSEFSGQTIGGFVVGGGAGVRLLRTSAVNLDIGFHADFLLRNNNYGLPQALSLRVGIYF
jgi:hypothetical protein